MSPDELSQALIYHSDPAVLHHPKSLLPSHLKTQFFYLYGSRLHQMTVPGAARIAAYGSAAIYQNIFDP
jgi:predicted NAD/FAD-binding protein